MSTVQSLISDERVLRTAMDMLAEDGPKAAGPDGLRLHELTRNQKWQMVRELSRLLQTGNYRSGPSRQVQIPKPGRQNEFRTLTILNLADQIVHKTIEQVLQPLLDPRFDQRSFGFRPERGREMALATAINFIEFGHLVWINEDLRTAFDLIPRPRLMDALRSLGISDEVRCTIQRCIGQQRGKGIAQGSSLSPLLLNIYLDRNLDSTWRREFPRCAMVRYADDLCICCRSLREAEPAYRRLRQIAIQMGMKLKGNQERSIIDLRGPGTSAELLGYRITRVDERIEIGIAEKVWAALDENVRTAHLHSEASARAFEAIGAFLDQSSPGLRNVQIEQLHQRILSIASRYGFDEIPTLSEMLEILRRAAARFDGLLEQARRDACERMEGHALIVSR